MMNWKCLRRQPRSLVAALAALALTGAADAARFNPPAASVQMCQWNWNDIAAERIAWLGPQGIGAVQILPPGASQQVGSWWGVCQPVNSLNLTSRMGTPGDLQRMIGTCHDAGVRVFADVVVNRMATDAGIAADGQPSNAVTLTDHYFSANDFHTDGGPISDADCTSPARRGEVMHCRLEGMPDLAVERSHVQGQVANHLCRLLEMGVDGFRIDAAKHMPAGTYCNVIDATRDANGRTCGGTRVVVDVNGQGDIAVPAGGANVPAVAIDTGQPIGGGATCTLTFIVTGAGTAWGQSLYVVGNQAGVGNWSAGNGFALTIGGTGADAPWSDRISLPAATAVQYKYVKWDGTGAVWECDQASASGHREFTSCASGAQVRAAGPFAR